jgi:uncharacterized caspase-like protein
LQRPTVCLAAAFAFVVIYSAALAISASSDTLTPFVVPPPDFPNVWAVLVGVDDYKDAALPDLRFAGRDARAMLGALDNAYSAWGEARDSRDDRGGRDGRDDRGAARFTRAHALLLARGGDGAPTAANVRYALETWLPSQTGRGDLVIVFLSGHGIALKDDSVPDGVKRYFVTSDADHNRIPQSTIGFDEIAYDIACLNCEHVLTLVDSCFSGSPSGKGLRGASARGDSFWRDLTGATGKIVLTASAHDEMSVEVGELESGLFTYYLTEGMSGFADASRDGVMSVAEIYQYARMHVSTHAARLGVKQTPQAVAVASAIADYALLLTREYDKERAARDEEGLGFAGGVATETPSPTVDDGKPAPPITGTLDIATYYDLSFARIIALPQAPSDSPSSDVELNTGSDDFLMAFSSTDYGTVPLPISITLPAGDYSVTLGAQGRMTATVAVRVDMGGTTALPAIELAPDDGFKQTAPDTDLQNQLDIAELFVERETEK